MPTETSFRILLPVLLLVFVAHRGYITRKYGVSQSETLQKRPEGQASKMAGFLGLTGLVATLIYVSTPAWLTWASLPLPHWLRWAGVGLALLGFTLLQWAQNTLGQNWSDTPRMLKSQTLVTNGPYRTIRHPIYTAFILIFGATLFIAANWLIGLAWLGMALLENASRVDFEEALLLEYFGATYHAYQQQTGRYLPKIF